MSRKGGWQSVGLLTLTVISVIEMRNFKNRLLGVLFFVNGLAAVNWSASSYI